MKLLWIHNITVQVIVSDDEVATEEKAIETARTVITDLRSYVSRAYDLKDATIATDPNEVKEVEILKAR